MESRIFRQINVRKQNITPTMDPYSLFKLLIQRLNDARIQLGYTKVDLAQLTNVDLYCVMSLDRLHPVAMSLSNIEKLVAALNFKTQFQSILDGALHRERRKIAETPLTVKEIVERLIFVNVDQQQVLNADSGNYLTSREITKMYNMPLKKALIYLQRSGRLNAFFDAFLSDQDHGAQHDDLGIHRIAPYIARKRHEKKWTRTYVASSLGITVYVYNKLENGEFTRFRTLLSFIFLVEEDFDPTIFIDKVPEQVTFQQKLQQILNYRRISFGELALMIRKVVQSSGGAKGNRVSKLVQDQTKEFLVLVQTMCALGYDSDLRNVFLEPDEADVKPTRIASLAATSIPQASMQVIKIANIVKSRREVKGVSTSEFGTTLNISEFKLSRFMLSGVIEFSDFFKMVKYLDIADEFFAFIAPSNRQEGEKFKTYDQVLHVLRDKMTETNLCCAKLAKKTIVSDSTVRLFIDKGKGLLSTFVQLIEALQLGNDLARVIDQMDRRSDQTVLNKVSMTTDDHLLPYAAYTKAYKNCRKNRGVKQWEFTTRVEGLEIDVYSTFERRGLCTIHNWILINFALGLEKQLLKVFSHPEIDQLTLTMSRQQFLLLMIGNRIMLARERRLLKRVELSNRVDIDDRSLGVMEWGRGGKLSTMFKVFYALDMSQDLFAVLGPDHESFAGDYLIQCPYEVNAKKLAIIIADRFRLIRERRKISVEELAHVLGMTASTISRFETSTGIYLDRFMEVAGVLFPEIRTLILEPAQVAFNCDWAKNLRAKFVEMRLSKQITIARLAKASGIHIREINRFERTAIIPIESLFCLYQILFDDFPVDEILSTINMI